MITVAFNMFFFQSSSADSQVSISCIEKWNTNPADPFIYEIIFNTSMWNVWQWGYILTFNIVPNMKLFIYLFLKLSKKNLVTQWLTSKKNKIRVEYWRSRTWTEQPTMHVSCILHKFKKWNKMPGLDEHSTRELQNQTCHYPCVCICGGLTLI